MFLSFLLLRLYRRATPRGMARAANPATKIAASVGTVMNSSIGIAVPEFIRHSQRYSAVTYLTAGFAYAVVMTLTWMLLAGGPPSLGRTLMLMTLYLWPNVIAICIVTAIGTKETLTVLSMYLLLLAVIFMIVLLRNPQVSIAPHTSTTGTAVTQGVLAGSTQQPFLRQVLQAMATCRHHQHDSGPRSGHKYRRTA